MDVFEVFELESIVEIEVTPFLEALGSIFEQNLGITREQWVVQASRHIHPVSRRILLKDTGPLVKILEVWNVHVTESVRPTGLELCPNFVQKWGPETPKVMPPPLERRIRIWGPRGN